jgi:hypothetical protein
MAVQTCAAHRATALLTCQSEDGAQAMGSAGTGVTRCRGVRQLVSSRCHHVMTGAPCPTRHAPPMVSACHTPLLARSIRCVGAWGRPVPHSGMVLAHSRAGVASAGSGKASASCGKPSRCSSSACAGCSWGARAPLRWRRRAMIGHIRRGRSALARCWYVEGPYGDQCPAQPLPLTPGPSPPHLRRRRGERSECLTAPRSLRLRRQSGPSLTGPLPRLLMPCTPCSGPLDSSPLWVP